MMNQNTKTSLPPEADIAVQLYRIAETLEELLDVMKDRDIRNYFEEDDPDGEAYLDRLLSPPHKVPAPDEIFAISIDPAKQPEKVSISRLEEYETFTENDEVIFEIPDTDMAVSCSIGDLIEIGGHQYLFGQGLVVLMDPSAELRAFQEKDFQKLLDYLNCVKRTILCGSAKKDVYRLK
jgi:hypothetical protein